jgi:hypothetical protein
VTVSSADHDLLLQAALLDGGRALDSWQAWRARTVVEGLDPDSQWLLPQLYCNLRSQGAAVAALARYRNVYRHNWYKNHLQMRRAQHALRTMAMPGGAVVVGGAAMALRQSDAFGARPFRSVELLAVTAEAGDAALSMPDDDAVVVQTTRFGARWDADVTGRATAVEGATARWRVLDPADQLVDICVRRHAWDHGSSLFWLVDVVTLTRRSPELDWRRVATLTSSLGQRCAVAAAFDEVEARCRLRLPPQSSMVRSLAS